MKKGVPVRCRKITSIKVEEANRYLEKLASQFPEDAAEYKAIELAAKALLFAYQRGIAAEFSSFLENFDSQLTEEQKKKLRERGIQP